MKHETKAALRDRQLKIDTHISKRGQDNAQRYLAAHHHKVDRQTIGQALMGAIAFLLFTYFALT
jgi:hypothetical protein